MSQNQNSDQSASSARPDPFFKLITRQEATQHGLQAVDTELQYTTRADLVLTVPNNLSLEGTMFDFFRTVNVIEFKGQSDSFNLREYIRNETRVDIHLLQGKEESFDNILNVIVAARLPRSFLDFAHQYGVRFKRERNKNWLWRGRVGFQDVAIVVCRDLPIEEPYYNWLAFAPADTTKWKSFVRTLLKQNNRPLLDLTSRLRPKEFAMLKMNAEELLAQARAEGLLTPEDELRLKQERAEANLIILEKLAKQLSKPLYEVLSTVPPQKLSEVFSNLPAEKLNDLISRFKPEERQELLNRAKTNYKQN